MSSLAELRGDFKPQNDMAEPANGTGPNAHGLLLDELEALDKQSRVEPPREAEQNAEAITQHFPRLTLKALMALPPKLWLVDRIVGPKDLVMFYGKSGIGKTFIVIDFIISACLGIPFAKNFDTPRPLTVAYAAGEGTSGLPQRFRAAAQHHKIYDCDLKNLHIFRVVPQLYEENGQLSAAKFIQEYAAAQAAGLVEPLDILVLDTLHSVTTGADENSSQHMGKVLSQAKVIAERLGCAVVLVHHTNKAGTGERGSSALRGAMDAMIEIEEKSEEKKIVRFMSCQKLKDGEQWPSLAFGLGEEADSVCVEWGGISKHTSDKRKSKTAREILMVLAEADDEMLTSGQIGNEIGKTASTVNDVMKRLVRDELVRQGENERKVRCYAITPAGRSALQNEDLLI